MVKWRALSLTRTHTHACHTERERREQVGVWASVCECVLAPGHVGELQAPLYWFAACVFDSRISSLSTAIIIGSDSRAPSSLYIRTYATRSAATPATCLCYYYCALLLSLSPGWVSLFVASLCCTVGIVWSSFVALCMRFSRPKFELKGMWLLMIIGCQAGVRTHAELAIPWLISFVPMYSGMFWSHQKVIKLTSIAKYLDLKPLMSPSTKWWKIFDFWFLRNKLKIHNYCNVNSYVKG